MEEEGFAMILSLRAYDDVPVVIDYPAQTFGDWVDTMLK